MNLSKNLSPCLIFFLSIVGHSIQSVQAAADMEIKAPFKAKIIRIEVPQESKVKKGDILFVLGAMKMEVSITAPHSGIFKMTYKEGDMVDAKSILAMVSVKPPPSSPTLPTLPQTQEKLSIVDNLSEVSLPPSQSAPLNINLDTPLLLKNNISPHLSPLNFVETSTPNQPTSQKEPEPLKPQLDRPLEATPLKAHKTQENIDQLEELELEDLEEMELRKKSLLGKLMNNLSSEEVLLALLKKASAFILSCAGLLGIFYFRRYFFIKNKG